MRRDASRCGCMRLHAWRCGSMRAANSLPGSSSARSSSSVTSAPLPAEARHSEKRVALDASVARSALRVADRASSSGPGGGASCGGDR
eukprot:7168827-Prymnesium_polylepis.1